MKRGTQAVVLGLSLLFGSIALDLLGSNLQSLGVLVVSFAVGIAGAIVSLRGLVDFFGELV